MPEGHTIHRHARLQHALLAGRLVRVSSPQGRFADADLFDRRKLRAVRAHGKHLLYHFTAGSIHVHLGIYGRFWVRRAHGAAHRPDAEGSAGAAAGKRGDYDATVSDHRALPEPTPSTRMRLRIRGGRGGGGRSDLAVDLTGPTACEAMDGDAVEALLARLGPDPIATPGPEVGRGVYERIAASRSPIGTLLMDQGVVAGVGNAYRSELLFRAGLDPRTPGREVGEARWMALWQDTVALLGIGVKHRHILCVEPAFLGKRRYRDLAADERFWVYKRKACRRCGGRVEHFHLNNRSVYCCPAEQPRYGGGGGVPVGEDGPEASALKHHA